MRRFKIDNEQIDAVAEDMKNLLTKCEEVYEKGVPISDVAKGKTYDELISVCENIRNTSYYLGQLIHKTIEFLGQSSKLFAQSEMNSASAIRGGTDANGSGIIGSR